MFDSWLFELIVFNDFNVNRNTYDAWLDNKNPPLSTMKRWNQEWEDENDN